MKLAGQVSLLSDPKLVPKKDFFLICFDYLQAVPRGRGHSVFPVRHALDLDLLSEDNSFLFKLNLKNVVGIGI